MSNKFLLVYFNHKDLPEVLEEYEKINACDKVMFSYFPYPEVINVAKGFLRAYPKYTHVIVASNDIIVKNDNVSRLIDIASNYKAVCGVMNVDLGQNKDKITVSKDLPIIQPVDFRRYNHMDKKNRGIIKVKHTGFSLMCMERKLALGYCEKRDKDYWMAYQQVGMDLNFSHCCDAEGIDIYADTGNYMKHLRFQGESKIKKKFRTILYNAPNVRTWNL